MDEVCAIDDEDLFLRWAGLDRQGLWNGRIVTDADALGIQEEITSRILAFLQAKDPDSPDVLRALAYFAHLGNQWIGQDTFDNAVEILDGADGLGIRGTNGVIIPAGMWSSTRKFCKRNAKAIIIGVAVAAVVVTAVVVTVGTGGAAAGAALAAGAAQQMNEEEKKKPPQPRQITAANPPPPTLSPEWCDPNYRPYTNPVDTLLYKQEPPPPPDWLSSAPVVPPLPFVMDPEFGPKWIAPQSAPKPSASPPFIVDDVGVRSLEMPPQLGNPDWLDRAMKAFTKPNPIVPLIEERLIDAVDPYFHQTHAMIQEKFGFNLVDSIRPKAPYFEVPLLGFKDQKTLHFHCGISNSFTSIVEGGLALRNSVSERFAVQPHLVHPIGPIRGLTMVGLEKTGEKTKEWAESSSVGNILMQANQLLLENSFVRRSIDYEVEMLSQISREIIAKNNPKLKQVHVTFSNGGYIFKEALKQLPAEYRDTIIVIPVGTTAIIEETAAHKVYNIIGEKDWPSITCNGGNEGIQEKMKIANVEIIPQTEQKFFIGGHYILNKDYQNRISKTVYQQIVIEYEIY